MEYQNPYPSQLLQRLWNSQQDYNNQIKLARGGDITYWNKQYLLGLVSEVDEVLREIDWKDHRNLAVLSDERNLALELADLTKFIISLWQHNGYSLSELLYYTNLKTDALAAQYRMDFVPIPEGAPIILTDIDGTLGNFRGYFRTWLRDNFGIEYDPDNSESLLFDVDHGIAYPVYHNYKEQFEAEGGYRNLPPYTDAIFMVNELQDTYQQELAVIAYTARPAGRYKYIWIDTYQWLLEQGIEPTQLHIGGEERVLLAAKYQKLGHNIVMLDDDPAIIRRASAAGIPVVGKLFAYNADCKELPFVVLTLDFQAEKVLEYIKAIFAQRRIQHAVNTTS